MRDRRALGITDDGCRLDASDALPSPPVAGAGDAATTSAENGRHGMLLTGAARSTIESCTADGRGCRVCLEPPRFSGRRKPPSSGCTRRSEASTARRTLLFGGHRSCGTPAGRMVSGAMAAPAAERRTYAANPARRRRGVNGPGGTHNWRSNGCDPGDWRCCCGRRGRLRHSGAVRRRYECKRVIRMATTTPRRGDCRQRYGAGGEARSVSARAQVPRSRPGSGGLDSHSLWASSSFLSDQMGTAFRHRPQ